MLERCFWCHQDYGFVPPAQDKTIITGICKSCAMLLKKKYRMSSALDSRDIDLLVKLLAK